MPPLPQGLVHRRGRSQGIIGHIKLSFRAQEAQLISDLHMQIHLDLISGLGKWGGGGTIPSYNMYEIFVVVVAYV